MPKNKNFNDLKALIKEEANKLTCDIHQEVCRIRDESYLNLENMVLEYLMKEDREAASIQTVFAEIEMELTHA